MRYLGLVANLSGLPHIIDICITEMVARTLKRIFNAHVSSSILEHQDRIVQNQKERNEAHDAQMSLNNAYLNDNEITLAAGR